MYTNYDWSFRDVLIMKGIFNRKARLLRAQSDIVVCDRWVNWKWKLLALCFFKGSYAGKFDKRVGCMGEDVTEALQYFAIIIRNSSQKYGVWRFTIISSRIVEFPQTYAYTETSTSVWRWRIIYYKNNSMPHCTVFS